MAVVHIGEATLSRRVSEFASTPSAQLCSKDFEERGREVRAAGVLCSLLHAGLPQGLSHAWRAAGGRRGASAGRVRSAR